MAEIRPFRGVRYNQQLVKNLADVICPPYDVITPQQKETFYQSHNYNMIRLEYGRELPGDDALDNCYTRAAATLQQWLNQGILEVDAAPAIYLHDHYFQFEGQRRKRRGIFVCVRLEEWERGVVRPHEETAREAKADRLNLLRVCRANLSAIYALYDDTGQRIADALAPTEQRPPLLSLTTGEGESHLVWAITEPGSIRQLTSNFSAQPIYIADGHHRYETALAYRRERQALSPAEGEAADFVMMALVDATDPGIVILPVHRLVRGLPNSVIGGLRDRLGNFFKLESFPLNGSDPSQFIGSFLSRMQSCDDSPSLLGLFNLEQSCFYLLRLRDSEVMRREVPGRYSETYRRLGVSIFHHIVLGKLLSGEQGWEEEVGVLYSHDASEAVKRVSTGEYQLLFLLNPLSVSTVQAVADNMERLLQKATYFYPKQPAGLVLNLLR